VQSVPDEVLRKLCALSTNVPVTRSRLCLWCLGGFDEVERVLDRMLWLNPSDNQGVRFLIEDVRAGEVWEAHRDEW
jgi:hypothetical protein